MKKEKNWIVGIEVRKLASTVIEVRKLASTVIG